jgi:protein-tyrosine phosphatase
MKSVLFVCLGNICRSPMAHGIFRYKAQLTGLEIDIESAGTSAFHIGEHADERAIATLQAKGIDIMDLRSRLFIDTDFDDYDYIFTMDSSNQTKLIQKANINGHSNTPEMVMNLAYPNENISVPDPYYGGQTGFEDVYQMLDKALDELIDKLR